MRIILLTILAVHLAACVQRPPEETEAQMNARIQSYVQIADRICAAKKGLPDYNECRWRIALDLFDRHEKAKAVEWAAYNERKRRIADSIRAAGDQFKPNPTISCSTIGTITTCQ